VCVFAQNESAEPNLLLISSYHPGFPTFYQQIGGIRAVLPSAGYNLDVEFMDSKRFPGAHAQEDFRQHLRDKLKRLPKYDLIFASDDNALHFVVENKESLFAGAPVVFLGVNCIPFATRQNEHPEITGVVEATSILGTIELARQLMPNLKTIYAISDATTSGAADTKRYMALQQEVTEPELERLDLGTLSWGELAVELDTLPVESAIILLSAYSDRQQVSKLFSESLSHILHHANVPVFHLWEHGLGDGIIGGKVISHFEQGRAAALMANEVLGGRDISTMAVETASPNRTVLDYNVLRKFHLSDTPASAEIINRPFSLYRANKGRFWTVIAIFLSMSGLIIVLGINIFQRRRVEMELRRSRQLFKSLFNDSLQFCGIIDLDGKMITANDSSLRVIEASAEEVVGQYFWDTPWWNGAGCKARLKEAVKQAGQGESIRFVASHQTKLGEITVDFSLKPIIENGKAAILIAEGRDISELTQLQERLKQNEKMESLGKLAGGVAHDFNNMLAGMIGFSELLADGLTDNPRLFHYTQHVISTGERAGKLTGQLLSFARKGKQFSVVVSVESLIADTIHLLERSIDKKIEIQTDFYDGAACVKGDPGQIQSVLLNLGVNARDAMPQGGTLCFSTCKKEVDAEYSRTSTFDLAPGEYVEIAVSDTGEGIPEGIMKRIFEPFFTTKEVGRGTGLGLSAVYGVITDHQGELMVQSVQGEGTTFRILLPLSEEVAEKPKIESAPLAVAPAGATILVVDDESAVRMMIVSMLERMGFRVICAENGREGLELYRQNTDRIALSIIDVTMPEMNGMELLCEIRSITPTAKIVIASGYSEGARQGEFLEAGAKAFLAKPFRKTELESVINQHLN
jgi:PAS domain S-box-containing protein